MWLFLQENKQTVFLILLLILFFCFGFLFAYYTDVFKAPDERMHYHYIQTISETGHLTQLTPEKVDKEFHQPPLYYWLNLPVYQLTKAWTEGNHVLALRIFALMISSCVIIITYFTVRRLFPNQTFVVLAATSLVALNPQFIFISGVINNDSLANLLGALCLLLMTLSLTRKSWHWSLSLIDCLVATAAFLTKTVLWPFSIILFLINIWKVGRKQWLRSLITFTPLYAAAAWWLGRNARLYHSLTGFGYLKQLWYAEQHKYFLSFSGLWHWFRTLYESFWARFGYFNIALPKVYYFIIEIFSVIALAGFIYFLVKKIRTMDIGRRLALIVLITAAIIIFAGTFIYSLYFYQPQGRYLFPVISVFALLMAIGLRELLTKRLQVWGLALIILFLLIINWQSLLIIKQYG